MTNQKKSFLVFTLALVFLASCATNEKQKSTNNTPSSLEMDFLTGKNTPEYLLSQGKVSEAAKQYIQMANQAAYPERYSLMLKAIHLLIKQTSFKTAKSLLLDVPPSELTPDQRVFYAYLNANIALISRDAEDSKRWLDKFKEENYTAFATETDVLKVMIGIYELNNQNQASTLARIELAPFLSSETEVLANQQAIIRGLLLFTPSALQEASKQTQSSSQVLWFELAQLVKKSKNPFRLGSQLTSWQELNPDNTIRNEIIAALAPQKNDQQLKIENIALLLPLSGPFKKPAAVIRDGFLATYYADGSTDNKPKIKIYDSNKTNHTILSIYQRAINEGADIVVGPLQKNTIKTLIKADGIQTPTLVLNQLENNDFYAENFYQFALSPEFEAKQTAQRAWQDGHSRVAIIYPDNTWGKRVITAFKNEWEILGGEVVSEKGYETKKNDFSEPLKALLAIDKSYERRKKLSQLLRIKLSFEPRRRQDIDFVFMAAFPRQAQLIPPQLKFFHAGKLPIYATSHSFSGKIDRKKNRDLDRLILGDMPWTLTRAKENNTKQQIYQLWPNKSKQFNRLYAFGSDAYYVLNYLNWLRSNSQSRLYGATGKLYMNETNQIFRELTWAKFRKGKPRLLPPTAQLKKHNDAIQ